jgi:hypothetical protein
LGGRRPGIRYEYQVLTNGRPAGVRMTAGLRLPPIEDRGAVALLVDETLAAGLRADLQVLERDLVAEGWRVFRHEVPRHDDRQWSGNTNAIARIRAWCGRTGRPQAGRCRPLPDRACRHSVFGSLMRTPHGSGVTITMGRPADHYYADIDGIWTDRERLPSHLAEVTYDATRNEPGDGKFDTAWVPPNPQGDTRLELAFGRVDFAGMPAFGRGSRSELELVQRYLDKAHRHRAGGMPVRSGAVVGTYFGSGVDSEILSNGCRTGSRLFGFGPEVLFEGDLFALPRGEAWAFGLQGGPGAIDRIRMGSPGMVTTEFGSFAAEVRCCSRC